MMTKKNLLILERSAGSLELNKEASGEYVLEGIFGEIDVKNKNNRIYTESEYVPQIKSLQDKIKSSKLLGELDHPANFDISLKNVSHIIEELTYDEDTKQVRGRIRLLDTVAGKQAKALVDAGVPLQISSRAAGAVESNGQVKIKQLFTYDLVADPGFANAELTRVNESFGLESDSDIQIYEINSTEELVTEDTIENKNTETMLNEENSKVVSVEDFNKYSQYLSEEIKSLKAEIATLNEAKESNATLEEVQKIKEYTNYLAETLDNNISYTEHAAEGINSMKEYTNYLAESFNESVDTVTGLNEQMDKITAYTEYVAETVNTNLIAEDRADEISAEVAELGEGEPTEDAEELLDDIVDVVESLNIEIVAEGEDIEEEISEDCKCGEGECQCGVVEAEATEEVVEAEATEDVIESLDIELVSEDEESEEVVEDEESEEEVVEATEEEVVEDEESEEEVVEATEEVVEDEESEEEEVEEDEDEEPAVEEEEVEEISEDLELDLEIVTESELVVSTYRDEVHAKLQNIIDASNKVPSTDPSFFNFVSESVQTDFNALKDDEQSKVLRVVEGRGFLSESQIVSLWNTALEQKVESELSVVTMMPEEYKETWNKLSEGKKSSIIAQSKYQRTDTSYQVKNFWQTRDLRETAVVMEKVEVLNESTIVEEAPASTLPYNLDDMKIAINKRFKK